MFSFDAYISQGNYASDYIPFVHNLFVLYYENNTMK